VSPCKSDNVLGQKERDRASQQSDQEVSLESATVQSGKASHKGIVRSLNEDGLLSMELSFVEGTKDMFFGLYAVADGVGGREDGEIASNLALRTLATNTVESLLLPGLRGELSLTRELALQGLKDGVKIANSAVYHEGQTKGSNMGTTMAAALVINKSVYIANVGDSRVYLLYGGQLRQVTSDHSLVASLVAAGKISPEEIYTHPQRNIITRCLGTQQDIEVDLFTEESKPATSLILCSDGLWEMMRDDEIKDIVLKADSPQTACERLIELANNNGGVDNISVIVVKICA
jgi:protein phosphatase